ncbi:MAG: exopolyphosphatase [Stappiaceae bacterium]
MADIFDEFDYAAPGRLRGNGPVSVIDIGSNSVRLVVYERLSRAPTALFNEKVLAGLGRGVGQTGQLSSEAVEQALLAIRRFKCMSDQLGAERLHVLATAAARESENGPAFVASVEEICGVPIEVLSGKEEAYYSAMGIVSGFHNPAGIAGDMGGGSLELVEIDGETIGKGKTFPLGGIRLQEDAQAEPSRGLKICRDELSDVSWLRNNQGKPFYAVGGTWRSLARLHVHQTGYPLHVMHEYAIPAEEALEFCRMVVRRNTDSLESIEVVSKPRRQLLPFGAAALVAIIERMQPSKVVFSALGVREGLLYHLLNEADKQKDPLFEAAVELAFLRSRSPQHMQELIEWTDRIFRVLDVDETEEEKRLRAVACLLSDIGWRAHPDYRGEQSLNIISNAGFVGVDHPGRAYLGLAVFYRHRGLVDDALGPNVRELATTRLKERARILGAILRLAHHLSGTMPGVILQTKMDAGPDGLRLTLPGSIADLEGERVLKRLNQLARLFGGQGEIHILT